MSQATYPQSWLDKLINRIGDRLIIKLSRERTMVMSKKEKMRLERLEQENKQLRLQIAGQAETEVPSPFVWDYDSWKAQGKSVVEGWGFNVFLSSYNSFSVYPLWSRGHAHYTSPNEIGTKGSGILYRTRKDALLAARAEIKTDFNAQIANIDRQIGILEGAENE